MFSAPPLTPELLQALKLISPELPVFEATEDARQYWELDYNTICGHEAAALAPLLNRFTPDRILELGPGMGRTICYFSQRFGWQDAHIDAYEGDGDRTKYTVLGPRFNDSFCGTIDVLEHILKHNNITNVTIINAADIPLTELPGNYDLMYSFYSVGFHWGLQHFLNDLLPLLTDDGVGVFMVHHLFEPFPELNGLNWQLVDIPTLRECPRFLVLSKTPLP